MKLLRRVLLLTLVVIAALAAIGINDVLAFDRSAASLQAQVAGYESAGMPASSFSQAERSIGWWRRQALPYVPYSAASGALVRDPLLADRARAEVAWTAWHEQVLAEQTEADLAAVSGGLVAGEPADISSLSAALDKTVASAQALKIDLTPGPATQDAVAGYWLLPRSTQLAYHDSLKQDLGAGLTALQSRVAAKQRARSLLGQAQTLLGEAQWLGTATDADAQATSSAAASVGAARTDQDLAQVIPMLQKLLGTLEQEANSQPPQPVPNGPCLTGAPPKLIEIHLVPQELVAYQDGCPFLATLVTTGRPALPTHQGTFHIFYKARWFLMQSPWPYWSPYWYPNTWVGYAMEFVNDGTFIHTADWEPPSAYGRGSEYGPYASHGCVHVEDGPAATLFAWAPIGTEVIVGP